MLGAAEDEPQTHGYGSHDEPNLLEGEAEGLPGWRHGLPDPTGASAA